MYTQRRTYIYHSIILWAQIFISLELKESALELLCGVLVMIGYVFWEEVFWSFCDDSICFGADVGAFECKGTFALLTDFGDGAVEWWW